MENFVLNFLQGCREWLRDLATTRGRRFAPLWPDSNTNLFAVLDDVGFPVLMFYCCTHTPARQTRQTDKQSIVCFGFVVAPVVFISPHAPIGPLLKPAAQDNMPHKCIHRAPKTWSNSHYLSYSRPSVAIVWPHPQPSIDYYPFAAVFFDFIFVILSASSLYMDTFGVLTIV